MLVAACKSDLEKSLGDSMKSYQNDALNLTAATYINMLATLEVLRMNHKLSSFDRRQ